MGIRTPDLFIANEPLYQLSYTPIRVTGGVVEGAAWKSRGQGPIAAGPTP
jgi:hypothetical protein